MKVLNRIRIILFALMIFGAFANFALNVWGNTLIVVCEVLMALSFLYEMGVTLIQKIRSKERKKLSVIILALLSLALLFPFLIAVLSYFSLSIAAEMPLIWLFLCAGLILLVAADALIDLFKKMDTKLIYENFFLSMFFSGLVFRNLSFPGAAPMLVFSVLFLIPYFITSTIKFFRLNYPLSKVLTIILTLGSAVTILLGIALIARTMHWPFGNEFYYVALIITPVMIIGATKWNFDYGENKINIINGLRLFKTHIILLFFMLFLFTNYKYLTFNKIAPDFYSNKYPDSYNKLRTSSEQEEWMKANSIRDAYDTFTERAEKSGFIK